MTPDMQKLFDPVQHVRDKIIDLTREHPKRCVDFCKRRDDKDGQTLKKLTA